jgi:PBSX family phage terminase large subunit
VTASTVEGDQAVPEALRGAPALAPVQLASVRQARARINLWTGAIRSGKTVASLLRWVMYVRSAPMGGRLVMVGRTKDTINRNVFAVLQDPLIFGMIADEIKYTPGSNVAWIFGRVIDVIGANDARSETRLRGMTCAGAYVDEATLVPQEFWTQLLGRMSVPGAMLFATTNPDNPAHWLRRDFILRARELGLRHWHFTLDDNPALSLAYRESIRREFVGLFFRRFVLGHWVAAEGAIYDMWDDTKHVIPRQRLPMIDRWLSAGIDYGTSNPFAAELLGMGVDRRLYVVSEYRYDSRQHHRAKTDAEYSVAVREWLAGVEIPHAGGRDEWGREVPRLGVHPEAVCVDPSAASFIVTLQQDGLLPIGARNDVIDGIRNVATLLATDRLRVVDDCRGLIDEFPGYSWDDDEAKKRGIDKPIKADDHSLDALRYGVHTTEAMWRPYLMEATTA